MVRPSIGQPLALDTIDDRGGTGVVVDAERDAVVPAESELIRVTLQVGLGHRVEAAHDAALEDGEEALRRVDVLAFLADVLFGRVVDRAVLGKLATKPVVEQRVVSVQLERKWGRLHFRHERVPYKQDPVEK